MKTNAEKIIEGIELKIDWELNQPSKKKIIVSALFMSVIFIMLLLVGAR